MSKDDDVMKVVAVGGFMLDVRVKDRGGMPVMVASSADCFTCKNCDGVHIVGLDANGTPFCEIIICEDDINAMHDKLAARDQSRGRH